MKFSILFCLCFAIANICMIFFEKKMFWQKSKKMCAFLIIVVSVINILLMYGLITIFNDLGYRSFDNFIELLIMIVTTVCFSNIYLQKDKTEKHRLTKIVKFSLYNAINIIQAGLYSIWLLIVANDKIEFPGDAKKYKVIVYILLAITYIITNVMFGALFGKVAYSVSENITMICNKFKVKLFNLNLEDTNERVLNKINLIDQKKK